MMTFVYCITIPQMSKKTQNMGWFEIHVPLFTVSRKSTCPLAWFAILRYEMYTFWKSNFLDVGKLRSEIPEMHKNNEFRNSCRYLLCSMILNATMRTINAILFLEYFNWYLSQLKSLTWDSGYAWHRVTAPMQRKHNTCTSFSMCDTLA